MVSDDNECVKRPLDRLADPNLASNETREMPRTRLSPPPPVSHLSTSVEGPRRQPETATFSPVSSIDPHRENALAGFIERRFFPHKGFEGLYFQLSVLKPQKGQSMSMVVTIL
jgi:hypothetical protein